MTEREFLLGIKLALGRVIAVHDGRDRRPMGIAIIDAALTFLWHWEQYSEAKKGTAKIVKPLLLVAFRHPKSVDAIFVDVVQAIDARINGERDEARVIPDISRLGARGAQPSLSGAHTAVVSAPSVGITTGESDV